ncbi:MAG: Ribonucleotide reductase transcriptional regulator NrdR [uncultured Thermomicrobiales bacterium]|uniref:Transcriptional repressor NrdR n=1 Tax=uncultured Thermomicrobiales bacterium TaxID=1645740 RepID=A0A6J4UN58_9BACT|nr:MAG: Ribonucleotide reductase transcriptional regulator NrdR [uncultured Thermomicrobiales bacterium]
MRCPFCRSSDSRVIDSRELGGGESIRRRRECPHCHRRFTTYERVETVSLVVVKKDGRREEFNPDKLRMKLRVALTKRPVSEDQVDALISRIEGQLLALGVREVPSDIVGEAALRELKELDQVAYIRFASVYREFADLEDLRREMEDLSRLRTSVTE